jgi:hypothetical protein
MLALPALVVIGAKLGISAIHAAPAKEISMDLPQMEAVLNSSADKKMHSLQAKFSLKLEERGALHSTGEIEIEIRQILSGLDFAKAMGQNGVQYIKDRIIEGLAGKPTASNIREIYVTDLKAGKLLDKRPEPPVSRQSQFFEGLRKSRK